jgi:hypothetical protein
LLGVEFKVIEDIFMVFDVAHWGELEVLDGALLSDTTF